jgi:N-acetylmuramoyl-L-alanine amidase
LPRRAQSAAVLLRLGALTAALAASPTVLPASSAAQGTATSYAIYSTAGRKALPFRTVGGADIVALDQVASIFGLKVAEDTLVGGLIVQGRGQPVLLIPDQSFVSIGPGRIVQLPAAVQRDRGAWFVPVEFIRDALGPAFGVRVELRRPTHVIVMGDVRVPRVTARFERQGAGGRLVLDVAPPAPAQITRDGSRLVVRFDAMALDLGPITGLAPEFVASARPDGVSIIFMLGPSAVDLRTNTADPARPTVDLMPAAPPAPVAPAPAPRPGPPDPPLTALPLPGTLQTIVLDPGHGGDDQGARGSKGVVEKDLVLAMAQRLKTGIEGRFGFRVLLTRERDENVPVDRRTSLANNNKADLFISLHANASVRADAKGAQVMSLKLEDYRDRTDTVRPAEPPLPVVGGGTRTIDAMPWDLAQLPFAERSATLAAIVARHLTERGVPLFTRPVVALPLRSLVGANMPAILLEVGFLSNADDERLLTDAERSGAILEALLDAIQDVRRGVPATASGTEGAP